MDDKNTSCESARYFSSLSRTQTERSFLTRSFGSRRVVGDNSGDIDKNSLGLTTVFNTLEESEADIIFIHGLGGGSRTTWCKDGDISLFWPQAWLPQDAAFKKTRIHTFGFHSNWVKDSILNVHDFAKSLLEWIENCPTIPSSENVSICASIKSIQS